MATEERRQSRLVGLLIAAGALLIIMAACAPAPLPPPGQGMASEGEGHPRSEGAGDRSERLAEAARVARSRVGAPYQLGESGPNAFDCSGLVQYAYQSAGLSVPRTVSQLRRESRLVSPARLREGDLLFFRLSGKIRHVAIYLGDDRFVHAPKSGDRVSYASLDNPFWDRKLVGGGRMPRDSRDE